MATRIYLPSSGTPAVAPAWDTAWNVTSGNNGPQSPANPVRLPATTVKSNTTPRSIGGTVPPGNETELFAQYVSAPMNAQTISGTFKGIVRAVAGTYPLAPTNCFAVCNLRVVSRDGTTVRAILCALTESTPATDISTTTLTNRKCPSGYATGGETITSYACSQGDRLVIEVGLRNTIGSGGATQADIEFGDLTAGSDLAENETGTTSGDPWCELSMNVVWETGGTGGGGAPDPGPAPAAVSVTPTPAVGRANVPWKVYLCDLLGNPLSDITQVSINKTCTVQRNTALVLSGQSPANDPAISGLASDGLPFLKAMRRTVKAYRWENSAWVLRANCHLVTVTPSGSDSGCSVAWVAYDPIYRLNRRLVRDTSGNLGISFDTTPADQIVRLLVYNANLVGNTGIQTDGAPSVVLPARTVTYDMTQNVGQSILTLAQAADGFDFWAAPVDRTDGIMARLMLYPAPPSGTGIGNARPEVQFGWREPPYNIQTFSLVEDGDKQRNFALINNNGVADTANNALSEGTYGPIEDTISVTTDSTDDTYLTDLATLALHPDPVCFINSMTVVPGLIAEPWLSWFIGDQVQFNLGPDCVGGYTGSMAVELFTVSLDNGEVLTNFQARDPTT
jgi:hypothetical protein